MNIHKSKMAKVVLAAIVLPILTSQSGWTAASSDEGYTPGRIRADVLTEEWVESLDPVILPGGETFTPYIKWVEVRIDRRDVERERDRILKEIEKEGSPDAEAAIVAARQNFDRLLSDGEYENCGFLVVQRLPDVSIGRASHSSICNESDPVNTHFWGYSGQVYGGLQAAGWGSDYCGPTTQVPQYLWLNDATSAYGFYQNYSGWAKGSCTGTRNHVRLWEVLTSIGGGLHFSVGTAHRETWSWSAFTHHVVPNGWHLGRDQLMSDHPASAGYYNWGNVGWWGSGGYFNGSIGEMAIW